MDAYPPTQPDAVCDRYHDREHKLRNQLPHHLGVW
jgi:hypothetical protein